MGTARNPVVLPGSRMLHVVVAIRREPRETERRLHLAHHRAAARSRRSSGRLWLRFNLAKLGAMIGSAHSRLMAHLLRTKRRLMLSFLRAHAFFVYLSARIHLGFMLLTTSCALILVHLAALAHHLLMLAILLTHRGVELHLLRA